MPKFDIDMILRVDIYKTFTIEAEDEYDARDKAVELSHDHNWEAEPDEHADFVVADCYPTESSNGLRNLRGETPDLQLRAGAKNLAVTG